MTKSSLNTTNLERPRLLSRMDAVLDHHITLITAPPGYGKTTLASQFRQRSDLPIAWHTIAQSDRDFPVLHAQTIFALQDLIPTLRSLTTPTNCGPTELAALLGIFLTKNLQSPLIYILDDVQQLDNAPDARAWLRTLITLAPKHLHLILISQTVPSLPSTDQVVPSDLLLISQNDLR